MKKYLIIVLTGSLFMYSCILVSEPVDPDDGIYFDYHNYTNQDYKNVVFYIGAVKNGKFIITDSLETRDVLSIKNVIEWSKENERYKESLKKDEKGEVYAFSVSLSNRSFIDRGGWLPNYDAIKKLSDSLTYKIKFTDGKQQREQVFMKQKKNVYKFNTFRKEVIMIKKDTILLKD